MIYYPVPISHGFETSRFEEFFEEYRQIFTIIAEADSAVFLHCNAGADRTGFITFILLALCGVQYEDLARDYLFTNFSDQGKREIDPMKEWWDTLDAMDGSSIAEKTAGWLVSTGVTPEQIEMIRIKLVEGYGE